MLCSHKKLYICTEFVINESTLIKSVHEKSEKKSMRSRSPPLEGD